MEISVLCCSDVRQPVIELIIEATLVIAIDNNIILKVSVSERDIFHFSSGAQMSVVHVGNWQIIW